MLFFIASLVIILAFYGSRLDYLLTGNLADGEVVNIQTYYSTGIKNLGRGRYEAAIIKFNVDSASHYFQGVSNINLTVGEKVTVIYKLSELKKAKVYSFYGYWYPPLIYLFFPWFVIAAVVMSIVRKNEKLLIEVGRGIKLKKVLATN